MKSSQSPEQLNIFTFEGWITVADCQPSYSGNYSCVPSYTTPDWVIVDVIKGNRQGAIQIR